MCGIAGIYRLNDNIGAPYEHLIKQMTHSMMHRGPDESGIFMDEPRGVYLGHRRLSIIDLNPRSNQPFKDHSGRYVLIFNGQIYNFKEISAQISGYPFSTTSDTEVIVAAYAKWGVHCLARFNGMFALAIYDTVKRTLFLGRDRIGIKPLYYYKSQDVFVFASEIRALLKSGYVPTDLDQDGLEQYLMFQSTQCPDTIISGVKQIRPGHHVLLSGTDFEEKRYWSFGESCRSVTPSYSDALKQVRKLLFDSVERRMMSDVPLGAFLSGGIDSSAIVAIMSEISDDVKTFSIVFDEHEYDESTYSDLVSKKFGTQHYKLLLTPSHFLSELPDALAAMDSPSGDGMNTYVVSKMTRNAGITVAMSGLGGDEVFAGYDYFSKWLRMKRSGFFALPVAMRKLVANYMARGLSDIRHARMQALALSDGSISQSYPAFRQIFSQQKISALTSSRIRSRKSERISMALPVTQNGFGLLSQFSIGEMTNYTLNVLLKDTDQFSMASSLEVREPFFDYQLVDYVMHLPDKWKTGTTLKKLLVDAMGETIPREVVYRQKKGFTFPWGHWLRNELKPMVDDHMQYLADRQEFNGSEVFSTWNEYLNNKQSTDWVHIWQLVALAHWLRAHTS